MKNQNESVQRGDASTEIIPLNGVFTQLIPELQNAITEKGYNTPSPIQEQSIPILLEGRDLLGCAQTGTGKTAAFTLPLLQRLSKHRRQPRKGRPRALILAPTRELAAQIGASVSAYGSHLRLSNTVIFGGVSQGKQVNALNRGVDVLVATPGRLLDLMNQGFIRLNEVEVFILDEMDRMLDMGFINDIKRILPSIPQSRQTLFFSATMPPKMTELAYSMQRNPAEVAIEPDQPAVERINQKVLFVDKTQKVDLLVSVLKHKDVGKAIVFTQMKHVANRVVEKLDKAGIESAAIHGRKSQAARTKALDGFKRGKFNVLVATDVAARGLDIDDISHVVNYDLPVEAETYVHRIGRTARAGAEGDAVSFCSAEEQAYLKEIERLLGDKVPVDLEHDFHCEEARHSTMAPPKRGGGGGGGGRRQGGGGRSKSSGGGKGRPQGQGGAGNRPKRKPNNRNSKARRRSPQR